MSERDDQSEAQEEAGGAENDFARPDEPTTKMPSLKRMGLLKKDAELHRSRTEEE